MSTTPNKKDDEVDVIECLVSLSLKKNPQNVKKTPDEIYDLLEYAVLIRIANDPSILPEILQIIDSSDCFKGSIGLTPHAFIYQAMIQLYDDGQPIAFETVLFECYELKRSELKWRYAEIGSIVEVFSDAWWIARPDDKKGIYAKFAANKIMERK